MSLRSRTRTPRSACRKALRAAVALVLLFPMFCPAGADVRDGVDAWGRGDYGRAVESWRPAAAAGDADAQFNLAQAYVLGRGVKPDRAAATEWFRKAAMQDHAAAEAKYGLLLFDQGKRTEATPWLEKAVAQHEPHAQLVLGTMLFNGDGVAKDWRRAYALLVRAAAADVPHASQVQAQMDKVIPVDLRQQGLALAQVDEAAAQRPQLLPALAPAPTSAAPPRVASVSVPKIEPGKSARIAASNANAPAMIDRGGWHVQLGAFGDPANAHRLWTQIGPKFPGARVRFVKAGAMTRVLVGPYGSSATAARACAAVKPCVPVGS